MKFIIKYREAIVFGVLAGILISLIIGILILIHG